MKLSEARLYLDGISAKQARKEIQDKRKAAGLSQAALARLSGVRQSNVNRIENGKQPLTPHALLRLIKAIEGLANSRTKEIETLRGIKEARTRVSLCERLPWMYKDLPAARAHLLKMEQEAKSYTDSLSDPIVVGLLESYEREIEMYKTVSEELPGIAAMRLAHDVIRGEPDAVDAYKEYLATGRAPRLKIDSIEKVEKGDE
jgi:transcriptional regulator with XRE-family HTH domain